LRERQDLIVFATAETLAALAANRRRKRCSGEATFAAIVDDPAQAFSAPRERIVADVTVLLRGLADKRHRFAAVFLAPNGQA
jgi:hypothetical protein